jgi:glycosyltransferase involved in cell wall biosynthesis
MTNHCKIAYVSRLVYPDPAANAIQTIQMAAAFARLNADTHLFVHDVTESEERIRQEYAIGRAPLQLWLLHTHRWPSLIYGNGRARFLLCNSAVAAILGLHQTWREASTQPRVLFVRSRLESLYWGLMRRYLWWLRDWLMVFEAHDLQIPVGEGGVYDCDSAQASRTLRALQNYDLVLTVTRRLAEDIRAFTQGRVQPEVVSLCTGLPRSHQPATPVLSPGPVLLGYIGKLDSAHGIDDLFRALEFLPESCVLRLVGPAKSSAGIDKWIEHPALKARVQIRPSVTYSEVTREIDECDILLAPAGNTVHSQRYRAPLKLFDYMARGKPIVAAGVPCHLELLSHGVNAQIYRPSDPRDLAAAICSLLEEPKRAEIIARAAWEESAKYTYEARALRVLELLIEIWERRRARDVVVET